MAKSVGGMKVIPQGFKVVTLANGQSALQKKSRSRKRYKLPAKTRAKIAANARKFKVPVLTVGAQLGWAGKAVEVMNANGGFSFNGLRRASEQAILPAFTGVRIDSAGTASFNFKNMMLGVLPNLAVTAIKRTGILKGSNQALARSRLPVRLS